MTEIIEKWIEDKSVEESGFFEMGYKHYAYEKGLTKGIEIAEGFAKWVVNERYVWDHDKRKYVAAWNNYWEATTSQLLEKYLKTLEP